MTSPKGDWLLFVFMANLLSSGECIGGEVAAISLARVIGRGCNRNRAARMLPRLAVAVPMKAKLGQRSGDFAGLLLGKSNPNPLANNFRDFKKTRSFTTEQRNQ